MKKTYHKFNSTKAKERLFQRYKDRCRHEKKTNVLLHLAEEIGFSPALLARNMLEVHLSQSSLSDCKTSRQVISKMLKDTTLIEEPRLAVEIHLCVVSDGVYGPIVDCIKHSIGHEYEFLLQKRVQELKLAYLDEDQLRAKGYDKTPDCKLEVPIAVDGHIVNWIESKASFGDEDSHKVYLKDQFWSYWNRFGPGLVIYWFGFIDELDVNREKGIVLMDHFPDDVVQMNPELLTNTTKITTR